MIDWKPVSVLPPLEKFVGYQESAPLLVWVSDRVNGFSRGRCLVHSDGEVVFTADGFNGKWEITHWASVQEPSEAK